MKPAELHDHIHKTYHALRLGLAFIAIALPFILIFGGYFCYGIPRQGELSAYYFAQPPGETPVGIFPMRSWFVGILCAVGSCLIMYRGFSNTENWLLNFAGISAIATAIIHMRVPETGCEICGGNYFPAFPWVHFMFAILFFFFMAWVSFACSDETLDFLDDDRAAKYRKDYDILATLMLIVVFIVPIGTYLIDTRQSLLNLLIMPVEIAGIFLFAAYWWIKSREIRESDADKKVIAHTQFDRGDERVPRTRQPSFRTTAGRIFDRKKNGSQN